VRFSVKGARRPAQFAFPEVIYRIYDVGLIKDRAMMKPFSSLGIQDNINLYEINFYHAETFWPGNLNFQTRNADVI
jgi:hypothetical protein